MICGPHECYFNCREVIKGDEFLSLPCESVVELISSDKLKISSEEKVSNNIHYVPVVYNVDQIGMFSPKMAPVVKLKY